MQEMDETAVTDSSGFSEPYAMLLLKICKELESIGDSRPKSVDKLKNLLRDKCYVTRFSAPFKLLEKCCQNSVQLKADNKPVPKVFAYYEELKTNNDTWKRSFEKMYQFLQYRFNAFPLELDDCASSKIEHNLGDWIATRVSSKVVPAIREYAKLREFFIRKCVLTSQLDPSTLVHALQQDGYIGISLTGELTYNLDGVDSEETSPYNKYLLGKLKSIEDLPKTEQALINVVKPFTNIIQSVQPSEMVKKYPQLTHILRELCIREFHLEMGKCFQSSSDKNTNKSAVVRGRGAIRRRGRGRGRFIGRQKAPYTQASKPILGVLLRSNKQIESISSKWNAPLSPQSEEEGVRRVGEWVRDKISAFEAGYVSTHNTLLQQVIQCSLRRELVPVDSVVDMLEQYGVVWVEGHRVEYDLAKKEGLEVGESEINNYLKSDTHRLAAYRRNVESVSDKPREWERGKRRGRGGRRGRMKRGKY